VESLTNVRCLIPGSHCIFTFAGLSDWVRSWCSAPLLCPPDHSSPGCLPACLPVRPVTVASFTRTCKCPITEDQNGMRHGQLLSCHHIIMALSVTSRPSCHIVRMFICLLMLLTLCYRPPTVWLTLSVVKIMN